MAVMVVIPAAIAWACNPQASISVNAPSYAPGEPITVYGSYFPGNVNITVSGPTGSRTVTTSSGGAFSTTFTVPSRPGSYVISASRPTGGKAQTAFRVAAPARAQAPAGSGTPSTGTAAPRAPSFDAPSVVRSKRQRSTPASGRGGDGPNAPATTGRSGGGAGPGSGVVSQGGTTVFSGSAPAAAPATGGTFGPAASTAAARNPARAAGNRSSAARNPAASEQSATGYAWSGFAPGRTPSLTSANSMAPDSGSGSGVGLGIGLLALGLVALVGGLTAAEIRRRRAVA